MRASQWTMESYQTGIIEGYFVSLDFSENLLMEIDSLIVVRSFLDRSAKYSKLGSLSTEVLMFYWNVLSTEFPMM